MKKMILGAVMALAIFVDVNETDAAPIHEAAKRGDLAGVIQLLDSGVDVGLADNGGNTPLMYAATNGHTEVVKVLLNYDTNLNVFNHDGSTALIMAASWLGNLEIVKILLIRGADANHANNRGLTALAEAEYWENQEVVQLIKKSISVAGLSQLVSAENRVW